jgi:hypothetical protein
VNQVREILQSARVADIKRAAAETAVLCKTPAAVTLERSRARRRLLMLLAHERRRNAKLVGLVING